MKILIINVIQEVHIQEIHSRKVQMNLLIILSGYSVVVKSKDDGIR